MKKLLSVLVLSLSLTACATTPNSSQYESIATIGIAAAIEQAGDPQATAKLVLEIAAMPLTVESLASQVKARIGYATLPVSQQVAIDAILGELDRQFADDLTMADKDATLALWRRAAISAASRFVQP